MAITTAQQAKAEKHLAGLIRTGAYGITTRKERLRKAIADGAKVSIHMVRDEARERAIEREIQQMRGGWGIPTGNEGHPKTIRYNQLKEELKAGPKIEEYRLEKEGQDYWNALTKTEYQFALSLLK